MQSEGARAAGPRLEEPEPEESQLEESQPEESQPEERVVEEPAATEPEAAEPESTAAEPGAPEAESVEPEAPEPEALESASIDAALTDTPLIAADESARFHEQIHQIQGMFVDDPLQSVRDADHLLEDIVRSLATGLEERRRALTPMWREDGSETEQLRQALRSYRSLAVQLLGPEN